MFVVLSVNYLRAARFVQKWRATSWNAGILF